MNKIQKILQEIKNAHIELGEVFERININENSIKDSDVRIVKQTSGVIYEQAVILYGIKAYENKIAELEETLQASKANAEELEKHLNASKQEVEALKQNVESTPKVKLESNDEDKKSQIVNDEEISQEPIQILDPEPLKEITPDLQEELEAQKLDVSADKNEAEEIKEEDQIPESDEAIKELESNINSVISDFSAANKSVSNEDKSEEKSGFWYDKFTMSKNEDKSLAGQFSKKKITDINTHIGINEKFLFTNELFKGDTEKFVKEIHKLNNFDSSVEALKHFVKLSSDYEWTADNKAYVQLKELVERRYLNQ
jgi:chromosome segregation ATPase